jgi:ectoine hydroxylase-related dioxygenase (phytanoyl-CoA dioxygenase family)
MKTIEAIEQNGFTIIDRYLSSETIKLLIHEITTLDLQSGQAGIRNLLELVPSIQVLAQSQQIRSALEPVLGDTARLVKGIFFDKQPTANWKVPWHQDLTIAVKERLDLPNYYPWSIKAGIHHVQPPIAILEQMLTVRIHLDHTDEFNGALKVIPSSHRQGKLTSEAISSWKQSDSTVSCNCKAGGILLMRPLLLHASAPAIIPTHRRVIHLEYASCQLPAGLDWYY